MITVGELISFLQKFPQEIPVVSGGFDESGFNFTGHPTLTEIVQVNDGKGYPGMFEEAASLPSYKTAIGTPFTAVIIDRE